MDSTHWTTSDEAVEYGSRLLSDGTVALRPLEEADLNTLVAWWNSPDFAALQTKVVKPRPVLSLAAMFRDWSSNPPVGNTGFSIVDAESGRLLGHLTIYGADARDRCADFAIIVGAEHVGRGVGRRATRLALAYAFRELGLNRVQLHVWAFNTRAVRAYEKAGFVVEGRRREAVFHDGRFHDELLMGALARDYFAAGGAPE